MKRVSTAALLVLALGMALGMAQTLALPVRDTANVRPIVGILAQPGPQPGQQYIAASYVKYLESAGARVVPIFYNQTAQQVATLVASLNGVLFTGGGADISQGTQFYTTGKLLFDLVRNATDAGVHMPLWGTCMGFELINNIVAGQDVLGSVDAENYTVPLQFTSGYATSRMFGSAPSSVITSLSTLPITMNNHQFSVYTATYASNTKLSTFFSVLSVNKDRKGVEFVSSIEGALYPVYATQWHPEKPQFEWVDEVINHSPESVSAMQYMANFFVSEARKNTRSFPTKLDEQNALIYNHAKYLQYTGTQPGASFEQSYIW